jgi:hypothetical protein
VLRLVDQDPKRRAACEPDAMAEAIDLLRAAAPYEAPVGRKQRVRAALLARAARRAPLPWLRTAVVIAVVIGCGAFASASFGHLPAWMRRAYERLVPSAAAPSPALASAARERRTHLLRPPQLEALPALEAAPAPQPASGRARPVVRVTTRVAPVRRHDLAIQRPRPVVTEEAQEQTAAVLVAMQALRRDRDPVRARALAGAYLARHPNGAMAEEALAISIEAAADHRDPDAAELAGRYIARYPNGPFRNLARQTVASQPRD